VKAEEIQPLISLIHADKNNKNLLICADQLNQRQKIFVFAFMLKNNGRRVLAAPVKH